MTTLAPQTLHFGSHFGALFGFGCKSENGAPVETGTFLWLSGPTLLGVIFAHFFGTWVTTKEYSEDWLPKRSIFDTFLELFSVKLQK